MPVELVRELYGADVVDGLSYFDFARGGGTLLHVPGKDPIPTLLAESGWSPEKGYEIYLEDGSRGEDLWDLVWAAGQKYGIKPGAPNQQRRVEGGMLSFGGDTFPDSNALELGLPKRFCNPFGDHDFIGKGALQKIVDAGGAARKFVGMKFSEADSHSIPPGEFWNGAHLPLHSVDDGEPVGHLTAFSTSPMFGYNLGLGFVSKDVAQPGTLLTVTLTNGAIVQVELAKAPFVDEATGKVGGRVKGAKSTAKSPTMATASAGQGRRSLSTAAGMSSQDLIKACCLEYSIEVTPGQSRKVADFANVEGLSPGTAVNVTYLVGADIDESIDTCKRLVAGGMRPVAHVPARAFATLVEAEDYLSRLSEVGVEEVLVLGGGASEPVGELHESMQILESGLLQKYGFKTVGVAAHPEGHPDISEDELLNALLRKAKWAQDEGVQLYYETQFCFQPEPIIEWEKKTRAALVEHLGGSGSMPTVRLGVAGPAKIANLIKFGMMSGVGNSLSFLTKYSTNVFKLATKMGPEELILGVSQHQHDDPGCMIKHLHFYPFGGLVSTLRWVNEQ